VIFESFFFLDVLCRERIISTEKCIDEKRKMVGMEGVVGVLRRIKDIARGSIAEKIHSNKKKGILTFANTFA